MNTAVSVASLASAAAVASPSIAAPAGGFGDAELIELGRRLSLAIARDLAAGAIYEDESAVVCEAIEGRATWPADQSKWSQADAGAYVAVMSEEFAKARPSFRVADRELHAAATAMDELCTRIVAMRPTSIEGLGVLALATATMANCAGYWDKPARELDIDKQFATVLIEAALGMAKLPLPFGSEAVAA